MTRLAFAIDGSIDIWDLRFGHGVNPSIAQAMAGSIGRDVLVYRIGETQGGYFGVARLLSISAPRGTDLYIVEFEDIRIFTADLGHPVGVAALTRLQVLDDDEFDAIVAAGTPRSVPDGMMEPRRPFVYDTEGPLDPGAVAATVRREANGVCALTGEQVGAALELAVIWPKGVRAGLEPGNFLPLSPSAFAAFEQGHFSARDDLAILLDMSAIDADLARRVNPTGRLLVPADPELRPTAENLAYHRRLRFGLA